jgi:hypothetical protein
VARGLCVRSEAGCRHACCRRQDGISEKRFYKALIDKAEARYGRHIQQLKEQEAATAAKGKKK